MDNLNKNQKIIIVVIAIVMLFVIVFYIMQKINKPKEFDINEVVENDERKFHENEKVIIVVHITGEVKQEGIIRIEEGARMSDVIEKAGGLNKNADLTKINLAYVVQDGQKIYIPNKNEEEEDVITENNGEGVIEGGDQMGANSLININKATQTELETLAGIGPSTAMKIIEYRKQNGKFKKIEDLMEVPGIGEAKFESIKNNISI